MLTVLAWIGIVVAIIVMVAGIFSSLVGMPGSIVVLVVSFILSVCTHWQRPPWWMLLVFLLITIVAELGDNILSAYGTKKYGGSTKAAAWALVGGVAGAIIGGLFASAPGALACALVGGFLGGYWYEKRQGKSEQEARRAGWGAFLGRAAGGLLKAILAATIAGWTIWMLFRAGGPFGG